MRVLLPFWSGIPDKCFYQDFYDGITGALHELGHKTSQFAFANRGQLPIEDVQRLYHLLETSQPAAVLDLACWGHGTSRIVIQQKNRQSGPILDDFGIPYMGWLLDHPCNQDIHSILARSCYAIYPDLGHPEQVRLVYPNLRLSGEFFAPPAVRPENDRSASDWASQRDIDVLYIGNLLPDLLERRWGDRLLELRPTFFDIAFCDEIADAAIERPDCPLELILRGVLATRESTSWTGLDCANHVRVFEGFRRHLLRRDAVVALANSGISLLVVGHGWDRLRLPANVQLGASTDYDGLFRLAARAKVCLDASTYLEGANDRVFSYALNGAVCFTNADGYLRRAFGNSGAVRFYSMRDLTGLGDQVSALLSRPNELREAGELAAMMVRTAHTWRHRVESLLKGLPL
jgi:hypothetical protein